MLQMAAPTTEQKTGIAVGEGDAAATDTSAAISAATATETSGSSSSAKGAFSCHRLDPFHQQSKFLTTARFLKLFGAGIKVCIKTQAILQA
jgi:hypothetical protein